MQNPHLTRVHIPAHVLGAISLAVMLSSPSWGWIIGFMLANLLFSGLGISVGFHRYFTHRSFQTTKLWHYLMLLGGTLAGQGSAIFWTALHRGHHGTSDKAEDLHSPVHGFWHAYMGWIISFDPTTARLNRAADLLRDPAIKFTHRHYSKIMWAWWTSLLVIAWLCPASASFVWGILFAGLVGIHQEAFINSACHTPKLGYQSHDTRDFSTNIRWASWLTWGQALHNNHHHNSRAASFSSERGELDLGYEIIKLIRR